MKNTVQNIIDELCQLDPELEKQRPELEQIIKKLLESQPDVPFDKRFKKQLYKQLKAELQPASENTSPFSFFTMKTFTPLFGGLAVGVALTMVATNLFPQQLLFSQPTPSDEVMEQESAAYGENDLQIFREDSSAEMKGNVPSVPRPQSGGGGGIFSSESRMMLPPYDGKIIQHEYNYTGEDWSEEQLQGLVSYRREKSEEKAPQIPNQLVQFWQDSINLNAFDNLRLTSSELVQTTPDGYRVHLNFAEGMVSIHHKRDFMVMENRSSSSKSRTDEELIAAANAFLNRFGITTDHFTEPEVMKPWPTNPLELTPPVPLPTKTVMYPLQVDGKKVYDQSGYPQGMQVTIDLSDLKATSLWGPLKYTLSKESNSLTTDKDILQSYALEGGMTYPVYANPELETETVSLNLGTPEAGYYLHHKYDLKTNQSQEHLIPALIYSVTPDDPSKAYSAPQKVVVPLDHTIIDEMKEQSRPIPSEPEILY